jgi:hypothetical protein
LVQGGPNSETSREAASGASTPKVVAGKFAGGRPLTESERPGAETGKPAGFPESEAVFAIGNLTTPIAGNSNAKTLEAQIKIKPVNFMNSTVSS